MTMSVVTQLESPRRMRERLAREAVRAGERVVLLGFDVRINDVENFHILYKDIFCRRLYHFHCGRPDPFILDCGSNIGMSVLYSKHVFPDARVVAFEPDPVVLPYLRENIESNGLRDVEPA